MRNQTVTVLEMEVDEVNQKIRFWFNELAQVRGEDDELESCHVNCDIDHLQALVVEAGLQVHSGAELQYEIAWDGLGWNIVDVELLSKKEENTGPEIKKTKEVDQSYKDEATSAFAYKAAKSIEDFIIKETNNLEARNQQLEGKILSWYIQNGKDPKIAEHFGIESPREGSV